MRDCLISICIPAYKRIDFLKRLLDSISVQKYRDFEVIVSDDSPGIEVKELCAAYSSQFELVFHKNEQALDTPENWNEAIRRARGKWIKLMHDDDWFSDEYSLLTFAEAIGEQPGCSFFFSAYANVYEDTGRVQFMFLKPFWKKSLEQNPHILIADNVVGPPSVTLHRNDGKIWYDRNMKYIVDIDFYIRFLHQSPFGYIKAPLVKVGINGAQVTKYTFGVAHVHLRESLLLLEKMDQKQFENILVFDGWWRLIRNFAIKDEAGLRATGFTGTIPSVIRKIIAFQNKVPPQLLRKGVASKALMSLCYWQNRGRSREGKSVIS